LTVQDIYDYLKTLEQSKFFGTVTIQIQAGAVVFIRNEQIIKEFPKLN
jgi:hypothetical protein